MNAAGCKEVSLDTFGGLCTEMSASDLPSGASPDNQDVVYAPGAVSSRPGLAKALTVAFPAVGGTIPTVTYAKSYVTPLGGIENLYLDSAGRLWHEDVINSPGAYTQIGTLSAGSYAKSVTAFGREYIATSDKLHGSDAPLQWDGTNLDRVTQDGPGSPPTVASVALPKVAMAGSGVPPVLTVTSCTPVGLSGGVYTAFQVLCTTSTSGVLAGDRVTIAGNAQAFFNSVWTVTAVYGGSDIVEIAIAFPSTQVAGAGGTMTTTSGITMSRAGNIVTVTTAAAHQLQVGYQAQIAGVDATTVGTITGGGSIVIKNADLPGIATVTTLAAHGLVPGCFVSIAGVNGVAIGGGIATISRAGGITSVATNSAHGLTPGAVVTIAATTLASGTGLFNGAVVVAQVTSATTFTYLQSTQTDAVGNPATGTVSINWPIPATATPTYFQVLSAPTTTSFQIALNYSDGTWTTGTVTYGWDGTFYVTAVPNSTTFQYQQYGPVATTATVGTVTPYGQCSPGQHQMQVAFLTRQGYLTKFSPPATFTANGGQYVSVSNIAIGPSNIVARILAFTGANGAYFFYIPAPAQVNGQQVSTATQVNDNTTTTAFLDFSDNTLFAALGVSVPGNTVANQIILDGALGFGFYASRLVTWGQRNRIQNLLNMGFDGGYLPTAVGLPTGWAAADLQGTIAPGHFGQGWSITVSIGSVQVGKLSQSFYQDAYSAPIGTPNATYKLRVWLQPASAVAGLNFVAKISSATTAFSSTATINGLSMSTAGGFIEVAFTTAMPAAIPSDMLLTIYATNSTGAPIVLLCDEFSIIYATNPYLDGILYGSYVNNPEAFDGLTGKFGPSQDTHKVMALALIRQNLYLLTQDPGGRLHETNDNGVTEPAGWQVNQIAANCGVLSAFGLTTSQADDSSASGGEEWFAWASSSGARIFGGDQPWKISQEIQPDWDRILPAFSTSIWAVNDPVARRVYFGLPVTVNLSAPTKIYVVDYRELDTAYQIAMSPPVRILTKQLVSTDHARKWTRWNLRMNNAALMYRAAGALSLVLCDGNGVTPNGGIPGFGNVYTLDAAKLTDDNFGLISSYYVTFFFPGQEAEQALQLGSARKIAAYLTAFVSGVGQVKITPYPDTLTNPWALTVTRTLAPAPTFDLECAAGNAQGQRIAFKFESLPINTTPPAVPPVTDNSFSLTRVVAFMRKVTHLPIRGSAS